MGMRIKAWTKKAATAATIGVQVVRVCLFQRAVSAIVGATITSSLAIRKRGAKLGMMLFSGNRLSPVAALVVILRS